jgi:hypothetical protein
MPSPKQRDTLCALYLYHPLFRRRSLRGGPGKPRELSVTTLYRFNSDALRRPKRVAYMRLSGEWLERFGFLPGTRVVVVGERGKLTLTVSEPVAPPHALYARR